MAHALTQPHSSGEDVTVISESEAWWKYGHLLDVVYIVVVVVVLLLYAYILLFFATKWIYQNGQLL